MENAGYKIQKIKFKALKVFSFASLVLAILSLAAVILFILIRGVEHLNYDIVFGEYTSRNPSILPALKGTMLLAIIAVGLAAPIGIFAAIFLVEYTNSKSKLIKYIRIATETLSGIPSIIYGLFGYIVFVVALKLGYSLLGGGLTLSIMVLPLIVRSTEESLLSVPNALREGSYALGASKVKTIFSVVLPSATAGIVTSIILAIGRVISESAVLILTIGMVHKLPDSLLQPGTSLALDVYYFGSHGHPEAAAETAVVLIILIAIINI
ncbi:MAG: phosphate ABC transporter permease PstA [Clostridia bacterium]|nr:phosphate ABC transporter permease PstA [Clostridia bacterium]